MKKILLAAIATLACAAFFGAGSASATVLCKSAPADNACPPADVYAKGTQISAQDNGSVEFRQNGSALFSCNDGAISGTVTNAGSGTTSAWWTLAYSFSGCNGYTATTVPSEAEQAINWTSGTHNGSGQWWSGLIQLKVPWGVTCEYAIGPVTELKGGSSATLRYEGAELTKASGPVGCPSNLKMYGTFNVETPASLYVEQKPGPTAASVLCKSQPGTHVCPAGDVYGVGTAISAQSITSIRATDSASNLVYECASGGFSGTVSVAGSESTSARLNETKHTYSSCTSGFTSLGSGEMVINWDTGTDDGVLTQTGGETEWTIFGVKCTYSIAGGAIKGGTAPKLVYKDTKVVKTAGGFLCPKELKLNAEYKITSPTPLYVEL